MGMTETTSFPPAYTRVAAAAVASCNLEIAIGGIDAARAALARDGKDNYFAAPAGVLGEVRERLGNLVGMLDQVGEQRETE
jgi:hypothetical protein